MTRVPPRLIKPILACAAAFLIFIASPLPARAAACDGFYSLGFQLPAGKLNPPIITLSKPAKGASYREPNFGTCIVRATDHAIEPPVKFARNDYSRRQAFNANNTYFIIYSHDGSWHLYDANSLAHIRILTPLAGDAEPQWHATDPNTLYYVPINGGTKLMKVDVRTNATSTVVDFTGRLPAWASSAQHIWTHSEGTPSADSRYWGFTVDDGNFRVLGFIVWDIVQDRLVGSRQTTVQYLDNVSMSAKGQWFITSETGDTTGVWAWSPDFTRKMKLANNGGVHTDLAIGANGHDYFVSVDYQSPNGDVYAVDMDTCATVAASATTAPVCPRFNLFSMYTDGGWATLHFSTKSYNKPGWVLVSTYDTDSNTSVLPWFQEKIMAIELKANPKIVPLAYTRRVRVTSGDTDGAGNYWAEPHASVNRDFTRVLFNSNWNNSVGADVDAYMIKLPATALDGGSPAGGHVKGGNLRPQAGVGTSGAVASSSSNAALLDSTATTAAPPAPEVVRGATPLGVAVAWARDTWRSVRTMMSAALSVFDDKATGLVAEDRQSQTRLIAWPWFWQSATSHHAKVSGAVERIADTKPGAHNADAGNGGVGTDASVANKNSTDASPERVIAARAMSSEVPDLRNKQRAGATMR